MRRNTRLYGMTLLGWILLILAYAQVSREKARSPRPIASHDLSASTLYNPDCCRSPSGQYAGYSQLVKNELGSLDYVIAQEEPMPEVHPPEALGP